MPSELDHAPHLMLLVLEQKTDIGDALNEGAVSVLEEAGASYETIPVKQAADLAVAASFAAKSKNFDATIVLADLTNDLEQFKVISVGLQQIAIQANTSIAFGSVCDGKTENAKLDGKQAAESAMRLFAIKARFNPRLNEA
ncbi:MAG: 6,7-dimethyl-8-ribityllumazine synthase [Alphaproteobacteria bacterium]